MVYDCVWRGPKQRRPYLESADTGMPLADKLERLLIVSSETQCWCDEPFIIGKEVRIQVRRQGCGL